MDTCNKKTVLVTGATGFIGKALCSYLFTNGFHVRALTRYSKQSNNKYAWVYGDITKPNSLNNLCENIDIVFHLAGFAHADEGANTDFKILHETINHQGTINILNESKQAGVKKFIFFSSVKACADKSTCIDETWNKYPHDAYGIAKRQAEEAVLASGLDVVILRPSLVYGVGVKGNLAAMLEGIARGYFPTPSPIKNQKSMISLNDLCRAALLAATVEKTVQKIFIVTDGVFYSTYDLVQMMRQALNKKKSILYLPLWCWYVLAKAGDCIQFFLRKRLPINTQAIKKLFSNAAYSSAHIKNELQFEPQFSIKDILPSLCEKYKS